MVPSRLSVISCVVGILLAASSCSVGPAGQGDEREVREDATTGEGVQDLHGSQDLWVRDTDTQELPGRQDVMVDAPHRQDASGDEDVHDAPDCIGNQYRACDESGKLWSFDSCGVRGSLIEQCSYGCAEGECLTCHPRCVGDCGADGCGGSCGECAAARCEGESWIPGQACIEGVCTGDVTPVPCDDANPCTEDVCDPGTGCANGPVFALKECAPARCDGLVWKPPMTCLLTMCMDADGERQCDDGLDCTADACDASLGCGNELKGGACLVDGVCHAPGGVPAQSCRVCDPDRDAYGFSFKVVDFELSGTGDGGYPWTSSWIEATNQARGQYSRSSGSVAHNASRTLSLSTAMTDGQVCYWLFGMSEQDCDFFIFRIDGVEMEKVSGAHDSWEMRCFPLSAGTRLLEWIYRKDGSASYGFDAYWVDDISVPCVP